MAGIRKGYAVFTKLNGISSPCGKRWMCSSSNTEIASGNTPSVAVFENLSTSKELINNSNLSSLTEITSKLGIRFENLVTCFKISPELCSKTPTAWENCYKEITAYGFSKKSFMRMVTIYPALFKMVENKEFVPAMENWMHCDLGYDNMMVLLATQPQFLAVDRKELEERIPLLKSILKKKKREWYLVKLLRNCPLLMYQDLRDVRAKIDYIEQIMKIDFKKENMAKCHTFNRSLDEIQTRHIFLERAGIYIRPPRTVKGTKLQQAQQPWSKNPFLFKITDTTSENFISKVAPELSVEELDVFREMYKEEINEDSGSDSDD
ncbi:hypothetical protein L9F63_020307 [Diploptera punctata]|uniref:Uncharacterized protein n=1 Tax=Diploptera punctata TaxID=6984 RepID=A0AAD8EDR9_DIPPU|nr:hypothetical protein L9F63_020307 [Diploptera punctata]